MESFKKTFTFSRSESVESTSGGPTSSPSSLPDDFWLYVTLPRYKMADRTENILQRTQQQTKPLRYESAKTRVRMVWQETHCLLVAGRKPTISIACCSRSKSCRRSSASSIVKFSCKRRAKKGCNSRLTGFVERRWRTLNERIWERSPVWGRSILRAAGAWILAARPPTRPPADSKTRGSSCVKS